ncbi:related to GPI anchored protein [Phialocephala subalpina]|uniref:Related to GPI anchored protein n=1 Tax=Phialocephala subalpina TaxID=576137 RepID=A0A1L7X6B0_9HELO|nr:related to GPI anchored protein [Phialocephala subalpina]
MGNFDSDQFTCIKMADLVHSELIWAVYSAVQIFYIGNGVVCAVTDLANQTFQVDDPRQNYTCEGSGTLNDPYEGELFAWWLYFFGGLSDNDKNLLWEVKRPQLVSVEYDMGAVGSITVQKGKSTDKSLKEHVLRSGRILVLQPRAMESNGDAVLRRRHRERVRTCNSVVTKVPGMFASVNNSTDPTTGQIIGYISNAGIPSISNQTVQELDVITPYSVFPLVLFDEAVGMAWWKNMADGKKMQNPYGSSESTRIDGTATSSFVSWDSKITTVNAILGGIGDFAREKMKRDGVYDEFIYILNREYGAVFTELKGEDVALCLPAEQVPDRGLADYTGCS